MSALKKIQIRRAPLSGRIVLARFGKDPALALETRDATDEFLKALCECDPMTITCPACHGRGLIHWHPYWDNGHDTCVMCNGTGKIEDTDMTDHHQSHTAPKSLTELTATNTAWYTSNDDEVWAGGPYDTREEAEVMARADGHRLLLQATKRPIRVSQFFDQSSFIEGAEESLYDVCNEDGDPLLDFSPDVKLDLQKRVRAAIDEWQVAHQLSPEPWRFDASGEVELAAWTKDAAPAPEVAQ